MVAISNHEQVELLTVREVAKYLKVDDTTVRRWIKGGVLAAVTLPSKERRRSYRIRKDVFEKLLSEGTNGNILPKS
jgi:excisionase family DNA binding protein